LNELFTTFTGNSYWWYHCKVTNSKLRKCNRFRIYNLAQRCHAKARAIDGINYVGESKDLRISLVFKTEENAENFLGSLGESLHNRKRSIDSSPLDVSISEMRLEKIPFVADEMLNRVGSDNYHKLDGADASDPCDGESSVNESWVSSVFLTEEVKLRLLDDPDSRVMYGIKPEKCHLKSQSAFPTLKNDRNNFVYISRHLHEHFDGISKTEGVPSFYLKYISHSDALTQVIEGKTCKVHETIVNIVFLDAKFKENLAQWFRTYTVVDSMTIQLHLYFEDPFVFKVNAEYVEELTLKRWQSSRGIDV
jgi:hypothetical protein